MPPADSAAQVAPRLAPLVADPPHPAIPHRRKPSRIGFVRNCGRVLKRPGPPADGLWSGPASEQAPDSTMPLTPCGHRGPPSGCPSRRVR